MAGPGSAGRPRAGRRQPTSRRSRRRSSPRDCRSRSWSRPRGPRRRASAAPTSAAARTARASGSRRRRTGTSTSPAELAKVLPKLEQIQQEFNDAQSGGKQDLARRPDRARRLRRGREGGEGRRARRHRAVRAGPHRRDAGADRRRVVRRARADRPTASATTCATGDTLSPETLLLDRANMLRLTAPEMTVLHRRSARLGVNVGGSKHGVFTERPGTLTNDFFVNLLDVGTEWKPSGRRRRTSTRAATARPASSSGPPPPSTWCSGRTRSCARSRRSTPATTRSEKFVRDFVAAWDKVMNLDRFDLL